MRATLTYSAAGAGPYSLHALPFLSTSHLTVAVDGVPVAATFDEVALTVTLDAPAAPGTVVTIARSTPRTEGGRLVDFLGLADGAAGLTADMLDTDYRQLLYALVEGRDHADEAIAADGLGLNGDGSAWDAEALRVETLAPGSGPSDAAVKSQLDTVAAGARNLPTSVLDNDDGLFVVGGEWDDLAPSGARTALGLGGVALLTAGVGANNVPQFSSDSPPRYPTADGRNIDLTQHAIQAEIAKRAKATVVRWITTNISSPGVDPASATWSQNSSTRLPLAGGWAARVELNNSGDVDGSSISPYRIRLTAGTWRIRWLFKPLMPNVNSATNKISLRLTNSDDTSSQVVYYDLGLHRPMVNDLQGSDYSMLPDSVLLTFDSPSDVVFRYTTLFSGGNNICDFTVLFHKIV